MEMRMKEANQVSHVPKMVTDLDRTETTAMHTLHAQTEKQRYSIVRQICISIMNVAHAINHATPNAGLAKIHHYHQV